MPNIHYFTQQFANAYGGYSASIGQASIVSAKWSDAKNYDLIVGICPVSNVASGSAVSIIGWQGTSSVGAGSKTVTGATTTYTSSNTTNTNVLIAQVRGQDLDVANGFEFVGFKVSGTNTGAGSEVGMLVHLGLRSRYAQATVPAL